MIYAIRHLTTGSWLGPFPGRAGGTHVIPGPIPRLFSREQYAQSALSHWLRGKATRRWIAQDVFEDGCEEVIYSPQADRQPEDWEVVPVEIIVHD